MAGRTAIGAPPARFSRDTSLSGRNVLQHASSRAIRIIASSARRSPSTSPASTITVDRQPIARNRRTACGRAHCDCSDTTTTGGGGGRLAWRSRRDGGWRRRPGRASARRGRSSSPAGRGSPSLVGPAMSSWRLAVSSGPAPGRSSAARPGRRPVARAQPITAASPNTNTPVAPAVAILATLRRRSPAPGSAQSSSPTPDPLLSSPPPPPDRCCRRRHSRPLLSPPPPPNRCCRRRSPTTRARRHARGWPRSGPRRTADSRRISTLAPSVSARSTDHPGTGVTETIVELAAGRVEQRRAGVAQPVGGLRARRRLAPSSTPAWWVRCCSSEPPWTASERWSAAPSSPSSAARSTTVVRRGRRRSRRRRRPTESRRAHGRRRGRGTAGLIVEHL